VSDREKTGGAGAQSQQVGASSTGSQSSRRASAAAHRELPSYVTTRMNRAEKIVGHRFSDRELLLQAITHPSALEDPLYERSYERLEFLGDAYLGAMVSDLLYRSYPDLDEGGMTRMKIALVSGETLSAKAAEIGLTDAIVFGSAERGTGKRGLASALENVFEALVAALVIDAGIDKAMQWALDTLSSAISLELAQKSDNPKSRLQELLQEQHITPTYELVSFEGPAHNRLFTTRVMCEGETLAEGSGYSIKEAEAAAAALALQQIEEAEPEQS